MEAIIIIQHNVLNWENIKFNLINTYKHYNPHITLLYSHDQKTDDCIKI